MEFVLDARYRLKADYGNEPGVANPAFHPDGIRNPDGTLTIHPYPDGEPLRAGAIGTVEHIVPAQTHDDGSTSEAGVVLSFANQGPSAVRHVSFSQAQIDELFELDELPPEHLRVTATDDPSVEVTRHFPGRAWDGRPEHDDIAAGWATNSANPAASTTTTSAAPAQEVAQ